jgi:thiol-disulfide isomerase/thioredoxin
LPEGALVVLYGARGCHLCDRARAVLADVQAELPFELVEVDITDDPELEARYREWLPVVEIGGERAFVYFVPPDALRRRLAQTRRSADG